MRTDFGSARYLGSQLLRGRQHELHQRLPWRVDGAHLFFLPERYAADNLRRVQGLWLQGASEGAQHAGICENMQAT